MGVREVNLLIDEIGLLIVYNDKLVYHLMYFIVEIQFNRTRNSFFDHMNANC